MASIMDLFKRKESPTQAESGIPNNDPRVEQMLKQDETIPKFRKVDSSPLPKGGTTHIIPDKGLESSMEERADIQEIKEMLKNLTAKMDILEKKITDQERELGELVRFSAERGKKLRRWEERYDMQIKQNLINSLIDIIREFDEKIEIKKGKNASQDHIGDLVFMRNCLLSKLENEGIISFGEEFNGETEIPPEMRELVQFTIVETNDKNLDGKLALQKCGFKLQNGDKEKKLKNAELIRYKFKEA